VEPAHWAAAAAFNARGKTLADHVTKDVQRMLAHRVRASQIAAASLVGPCSRPGTSGYC
jgi:hypothetical protein